MESLQVEYLFFVRRKEIKSSSVESFNHLLQSDPLLKVNKSRVEYNKLIVEYIPKSGQVNNSDNTYFHLTFICKEEEKIDKYIALLKAVKNIIHIVDNNPQILYDGVSLYYSKQAYPLIFNIESLMRKLITKFMLTNVGLDWTTDRTPEDVKTTINKSNRDETYLHNVDFIQLKNFLFSENYPVHKDNLIQKLKLAKDISDLNLSEIKALIPNSNWEKFFSGNIEATKENIGKQWELLYDLRCKIAHNRVFTKGDFEETQRLYNDLVKIIEKAIDNLKEIDIISQEEKQIVTETIAGNFHYQFGEFIFLWNKLEKHVSSIAKKFSTREFTSVFAILSYLRESGIIDKTVAKEALVLNAVRNDIVHNADTVIQVEAPMYLERLKRLEQYFSDLNNS